MEEVLLVVYCLDVVGLYLGVADPCLVVVVSAVEAEVCCWLLAGLFGYYYYYYCCCHLAVYWADY